MAGKLLGSLQTDLSTRVYRVTSGFNEALYLAANEPSLGMYRLQEHIQVNVPKVVEQRQSLHQVHQRVEGACFDLEYNKQAVQNMSRINQFPSITRLLMRAVELKTKLTAVESEAISHTVRGPEAQCDAGTSPLASSSNSYHTLADNELKPKQFDY